MPPLQKGDSTVVKNVLFFAGRRKHVSKSKQFLFIINFNK